jgi:hypothetical protein
MCTFPFYFYLLSGIHHTGVAGESEFPHGELQPIRNTTIIVGIILENRKLI